MLAIWRGREARLHPAPDEMLQAGDLLLMLGREERVRLLESLGLQIGRNGTASGAQNGLPVELAEVIIGPRAPAIGQTLKQLHFRATFGLTAVALCWKSLGVLELTALPTVVSRMHGAGAWQTIQ